MNEILRFMQKCDERTDGQHFIISRPWPKPWAGDNKGTVAGFLPTTESKLRTALGVEIYKLGIIARICKPPPLKLFSDLCSEMGICSDVM